MSFGRATPIVPFENTSVAVLESGAPLQIQNGDEVRWNHEHLVTHFKIMEMGR